jgi:hypothetical protein
VNGDGLVAVPPGVVTVTEPLVAPAGTAVVTFVAVSVEMTPAVPLLNPERSADNPGAVISRITGIR